MPIWDFIALSSNDDKRMQPIDAIKTYACETSKDLVREKEEIKCSNIITQMIKSDDVTKENIKKYNPNWHQTPDHPRKN